MWERSACRETVVPVSTLLLLTGRGSWHSSRWSSSCNQAKSRCCWHRKSAWDHRSGWGWKHRSHCSNWWSMLWLVSPKSFQFQCSTFTPDIIDNYGPAYEKGLDTLSNRCRWPDDSNWKCQISFETSLRMYNTLWPDVALKLRTWVHGVSRHDENPSTSCFCFDPFSVLLCYFHAEPK